MTASEKSMLSKITALIVRELSPEKIILFGSRARGTATPHSDMDLLIVEDPDVPSKLSRRQKMAHLWKLLAPFPVPQDILIYSSTEIEKWESTKNHVIAHALREGKVSTFLNVMTVNPDTGGGFVVFPSVEQAISSVARDLHPFIGETREKVMEEGDAFEEALSLDASGVAWVGETSARTETTTPTLKVARTPLNEIYSMPKISQRLIDDANTNVLAWLTENVAMSVGEALGEALITGNGVARPRGILTYPVSTDDDTVRDWGTVQVRNSGANGSFPAPPNSADVLFDLVADLKPAYRARSKWLMSSAMTALCRKLKTSDGVLLWSDGLKSGEPPLLLGREVVVDESMPTPATNSLSLALGDFHQAYQRVSRPGVKFLFDPFSEKGFTLVYSYARRG